MKRLYIYILIVFIFLFNFLGNVTFANSILYSQLESDYVLNASNDQYPYGDAMWSIPISTSMPNINTNTYISFWFKTSGSIDNYYTHDITLMTNNGNNNCISYQDFDLIADNEWHFYSMPYAGYNYNSSQCSTPTGGNIFIQVRMRDGGNWSFKANENLIPYYIISDYQLSAPPILNTDTRIISLSPESNLNIIPLTQSSTTKYSNFDIDLLEYYNNPATNSIAFIGAILTNKTYPQFTFSTNILDNIATGTATTSFTIYDQIPFGTYDLTIRLFDSNLSVIDATTSTNILFGSSTLPSITFEDVYGATSTVVFNNVQKSVLSYVNLIATLKSKAPFGYFYTIKDAFSNINTATTTAFSVTIPAHLKSYFFTPFDISFSAILWFYFIVFFYKRLKHLHI